MGWVPPSIARKKLVLDTGKQDSDDSDKVITKGRFRILPSGGDMYVQSPYSRRVKFALDDRIIHYEPHTEASVCGDSNAAYDAITMDEINCALRGQDPNYSLLGRKRHDRLKTFASRWRAQRALQAFKAFREHRIMLKKEMYENELREVDIELEDEPASSHSGDDEEHDGRAAIRASATLEGEAEGVQCEPALDKENIESTSCRINEIPSLAFRRNSHSCDTSGSAWESTEKTSSVAGDLPEPLGIHHQQHGNVRGFDLRSRVLRPRVYSDTVIPNTYIGALACAF